MKDAVSVPSNFISQFINTLTYFNYSDAAGTSRADGYASFLRSYAKSSPAPQAAQKALTLNLFWHLLYAQTCNIPVRLLKAEC